ncbi:hypothetical protein MGSAQ_001029 [marine sediment metagenome]|uniref:Uncharacterized protein n=1 Tax=marine sediment metagenome TaxID=412755 RepID=A0A1B6NVJ9_9ZZZZ
MNKPFSKSATTPNVMLSDSSGVNCSPPLSCDTGSVGGSVARSISCPSVPNAVVTLRTLL